MISLIKSILAMSQEQNMIIMKLILFLTLARKTIPKQNLDFSTNSTNMKKLATREWNSTFTGEKQKVPEHI